MTEKFPVYICHKRVQALEIASVGSYELSEFDGKLRRRLTFKEEGHGPFDAIGDLFTRYVPEPGDFYVVYEDGYRSFSPRKAFLDGYTREPEPGVNVMMERLNDLANAKTGNDMPEWLQIPTWSGEVARVAREAYVTINSLKHQLETSHRKLASLTNLETLSHEAKTDDHQA